jgi:hypothetical protein
VSPDYTSFSRLYEVQLSSSSKSNTRSENLIRADTEPVFRHTRFTNLGFVVHVSVRQLRLIKFRKNCFKSTLKPQNLLASLSMVFFLIFITDIDLDLDLHSSRYNYIHLLSCVPSILRHYQHSATKVDDAVTIKIYIREVFDSNHSWNIGYLD